MTKTRLSHFLSRVAPILLALGFWLVGNALVGNQIAKAQEVADGHFQHPTPKNITYSLNNNCASLGSCTRFREEVWGCIGGGGLSDSCDSSKYQSVSVYYETTSHCMDGASFHNQCDWSPNFMTSVKQPDTCEKSSVKTGNGSCTMASLPASGKKTPKKLRIAFNTKKKCRMFSPLALEVIKIDV